jgi:hypothetical protein
MLAFGHKEDIITKMAAVASRRGFSLNFGTG